MIMKRTSIILTAALGIGLAACANSNSQSGDGKVVNDSTEIIVKKVSDVCSICGFAKRWRKRRLRLTLQARLRAQAEGASFTGIFARQY